MVLKGIEFWQGKESRLHDRLIYENIDGDSILNRLWRQKLSQTFKPYSLTEAVQQDCCKQRKAAFLWRFKAVRYSLIS